VLKAASETAPHDGGPAATGRAAERGSKHSPTSQWPAVFAGVRRSCLRTWVNVRRRAAEHGAGEGTGIKPAERDGKKREKRAAHPGTVDEVVVPLFLEALTQDVLSAASASASRPRARKCSARRYARTADLESVMKFWIPGRACETYVLWKKVACIFACEATKRINACTLEAQDRRTHGQHQ
jgi:hypothetical protein